jgi:hypothetical protein
MTDPADPCEVAPDRLMACTERLCLRVVQRVFVFPVKGTTMGYAILPEYRGRGLATEAATVAGRTIA